MYINISLFILFSLFSVHSLIAQESDKDKYVEAESYFLYEEYRDALPLYLELKKRNPQNYNLDYKIGRCYLFIPYQKEKAITYLKKASESTSESYRGKSLKETDAPIDVYFYLGRAYHIQNQLDDAIIAYQNFLAIMDEAAYDKTFVNLQIESCKFAAEALKNPNDISITNIGEPVNNRFAQSNAVVSGDGNTLIYTSKLQFYDAVFVSTKDNGNWSSPKNIIPELKVDDKIYPTALSYDGDELYLYKLDGYDGNIYVSSRTQNTWGPPVKLNDNINTKYWESHASVSRDGKILYFTSNRPGGFGELDIYFAIRNTGHDWGKPVNAGNSVNSNQNEDTPFITTDGKKLYFSSLGHTGMGGYDIFYAEKSDEYGWEKPVNLGYPVNTTDDNMFFYPVDNGNFAIYSLIRKDGHGLSDIYMVDMLTIVEPTQITLNVEFNNSFDNSLHSKIIETKTSKIIREGIVESGKTSFSTTLAPGKYRLLIDGTDIETHESFITVDDSFDGKEKELQIQLQSKEKNEATDISVKEKKRKEDSLILKVSKEDIVISDNGHVRIELTVPENSRISTTVEHDNEQYKKNSYFTNKTNFVFEFDGKPGSNQVHLELTHEGQKVTTTLSLEIPSKNMAQAKEPNQKSTDIKLILNDLLEIYVNDALKQKLRELKNNISLLATADDLYLNLTQIEGNNGYNKTDVDKLMERYLLSLIRYYEYETLKSILSQRISPNTEPLYTENINTAFSELDNILYAITRLVLRSDISLDKIDSGMQSLGLKYASISIPDMKSEIQEWLESIFKNNGSFNTDAQARAGALSLLEFIILSNHVSDVYHEGNNSVKKFYKKVVPEKLKQILTYKDYLAQGIGKGELSYNDIIQALLQVNKQLTVAFEDEVIDESVATHPNSSVDNTFSILMYGAGGLLLLIITLAFVRRKRKKTQQ